MALAACDIDKRITEMFSFWLSTAFTYDNCCGCGIAEP